MVYNEDFKTHLQALAETTIAIYYKNFPPEKLAQYDKPIRAIMLMHLDPTVKENQKFKECAELMENDEHIKALNDKLVGTSNSLTRIEDNSFILLSFLTQLYIKNPNYDQEVFNQAYLSFEELFYSTILRLRDSSRLNNFNCDIPIIEFEQGIKINKSPIQRVMHATSDRMDVWEYTRPHVSDFIIERQYEREKVIRSTKVIGDTEVIRDIEDKRDDSEQSLSKTVELFDLLISALRILKPSAVFRDAKVSSELLTFHPMPYATSTVPLSETILRGEECVLTEDELPVLKGIYSFLTTEKDSRFNVAQRRLSTGMERYSIEDSLIDYMIGLEALYLTDGNQELTFKLSLRSAFLLCTNPDERKETYDFVKDMYKTRSAIVHGSTYNLVKEEVVKLEELLRKSLKLWLNGKSMFSASSLSNIFFMPETT